MAVTLPLKRSRASRAPRQLTLPPDAAVRYAGRMTLDEALTCSEDAGIRALSLGTLVTMKIPPRPTLMAFGQTPVIRAGQLGQVFAERGLGKTWFDLTLALLMACGTAAMDYHAPTSSRVLYVDGEMATEDLQDRVNDLVGYLGIDAEAVADNLVLVGADWQDEPLPALDTSQGQQKLEPLVDWADVVFLDNRSCLFSSEGEKDPAAWEPAAAWIASLRRRKKACILVHHANRQGGARGHSKAEDALDFIIKLEHPDDYHISQGARFTIGFEKSRGIPGGSALIPRTVRLTDTGWIVEEPDDTSTTKTIEDRIIEAVRSGSFRTKTSALAKVKGKGKAKYEVWDELVAAGTLAQAGGIWAVSDMVAVA
jgi:hypothetical protein